jgi:hypothetical protein
MAELVRSATAQEHGIDNTPPAALLANGERLCAFLGEVFAMWGSDATISSGYRCPLVNKLVGSQEGSAHEEFRAGDLNPTAMPLEQCFDLLARSDLPFDQLIEEGMVRDGVVVLWLHIAIARDGETPRREVLRGDGVQGHMHYTRIAAG